MRDILVLRFSSLGDVVLSTALLDAIHQREPESRVWYVTKPAYASLFERDDRVHRVLAVEPGIRGVARLARILDDIAFDLVLDAHGSLRSRTLTSLMAPTPTRRIAKDSLARLWFVWTKRRPRSLDRSAVDRFRDLVEFPPSSEPRLQLDAEDREAASAWISDAPTLAVAPGARHETKRFGADRFAEVAARTQSELGADVLVVGGPDEREVCEQVTKALPSQARELVPGKNLRQVAAALEGADLLLCNDSGLMHMAEAVGTPVLAVFGPTSREFGFFPRHPHSRVVEHALDCRPCSRTGSRPCSMEEQWCLTRSTPHLVFGQLEVQWRRILESSRPTST